MGLRKGCDFSPNLFNLYRKAILRDLEVLTGLIISNHNLNNIRYAHYTNLIENTEMTLQNILHKLQKKSERTIHRLQKERMHAYQQKDKLKMQIACPKYYNKLDTEF